MRAHAGSRLKGRPVRRASFYKRPSNAIFVFLLLFVVVVYAFTFLRPAAVHSRNSLAAAQQQQRGSQKGAFLSSSERLECGLGVTTSLGFDYPQLRTLRGLVREWCEQQQQQQQELLPWRELTAAYASALSAAHPGSSSSDRASSSATSGNAGASVLLAQLLAQGFNLLSAEKASLLNCRHDGSLDAAWQSAHASNTSTTTSKSSSSSAKRHLLAANFHNSAAMLPNFLMQVLRLALKLPHGSLAVGVYESGSSDTSRMWLTLLHQLLLPLGVPHNITLGGRLSPRQGLGRIQLLAGLRNAALEPWLPPRQPSTAAAAAAAAAANDPDSAATGTAAAAAAVAGSAVLSFKVGPPGSWVPDVLMYANDVFLCTEDVMRLLLHGANIACGMDFYDAPWMSTDSAAGELPPSNATVGSSDGGSGSSDGGSGSSDGGSQGVLPGLVPDDDFFDPVTGRVKPLSGKVVVVGGGGSSSGSSGSGSGSGLAAGGGSMRFYDKWVARDAGGHRLVNRPPFITHHPPSQAALSAGQPVPMSCCWNGLAVLAAHPFTAEGGGLRFRTGHPGECRGSECSLMCEDFARLGLGHIVMDPGVRLAYELEQVDALGGAGSTQAAAAAAAAGPAGQAGLGPWLPWGQVSGTARALQRAATRPKAPGPVWMECCDLQPGQSYVDFTKDCHMVDVRSSNRSQTAPAPAG